MKKGFQIVVACLITLAVVTVGGVLPHHHETGGGICFAVEHSHNHSAQDEEGCPLESELLAWLQHSSSQEHGSRCGLCDHDHSNDHLTLLLSIDERLTIGVPPEVCTDRKAYDPHTPPILAAWAKGVSLRAPPVC